MTMNKPTHITKGDVLEDLGFSHSETSALKIKASIVEGILHEIERRGYTQGQLVEVLDEYQPNVSSLLNGRISKVSIEKLLGYADRLRIVSAITLRPAVRITARPAVSKRAVAVRSRARRQHAHA